MAKCEGEVADFVVGYFNLNHEDTQALSRKESCCSQTGFVITLQISLLMGPLRMAHIYIKLYRDRMDVENISAGIKVTGYPDEPFTTRRLLLGQMIPAMKLLSRLIKEVDRRPFIIRKLSEEHRVIVHPMEMNEGGHSQLEFRGYIDLARSISENGKYVFVCSKPTILTATELEQVFSGKKVDV